MGFLDKLKEFQGNLATEVKKFSNKKFMEAACATSCLIAAADGSIDSEEKMKTVKFMELNESLKVFKAADVAKSFNEFAEMFDFDPGMGKDKCFEAIKKIKDDEAASRACLRLGCVIGAADGDFDDDEKAMVREIAGILGLSAGEFLD